jgi:hypothetical protein
MQHSDLAFATHHADKGAIVPILAGATWNPLLRGVPSGKALRAREAIEGEVSITYIVGIEAALGFDEAEVDSSQEEKQDNHTISGARPTVIEGDEQALEDSSFQNPDATADGKDESVVLVRKETPFPASIDCKLLILIARQMDLGMS